MAFQTPITIAQAIQHIQENRYLLPAIQREFVWGPGKIEWLFDSIMRDYPIASFLFWQVKADTAREYKFYEFIKYYKEKYATRNPEHPTGASNFTAILDGQQRLTSLYIGLCGSYAYKKKYRKEENTENSYPTRKLHLNISKKLQDEEDGRIYEFKFLTTAAAKETAGSEWFSVSAILQIPDFAAFNKFTRDGGWTDDDVAYEMLSLLHSSIHSKPIINHYLVSDQEIDKALNIFIRTNSGGQPLSFSDLIMSIAVANWKEKDARKVIHGLTDNVRDKGFTISKDFILKTFLFLHSKDIKFKVTNFSASNARAFEDEWDDIYNAILSVFDLVKTFGFTDSTLISKNALIPIVYYLYHRGIADSFSTKTQHKKDRDTIKKWLHTMLVKKIFGVSADTVLNQIRGAFTADVTKKSFSNDAVHMFPAGDVNENIRRNVGITDEFIEELLFIQKDDKYAFSILALLYPHLDYANNDFHKDHMHPVANYDQLSDSEEKYWYEYHSLINLQMLSSTENKSKQDKSLATWVKKKTKNESKTDFYDKQIIPDVSLKLEDFGEFADARKKLLAEKLKQILT